MSREDFGETASQLTAQPGLVRAKAGSIQLAAAQLLLLRAQRRLWERRMGELLLGGHRPARAKSVKNPDPAAAFPAGDIYLSMPGLGVTYNEAIHTANRNHALATTAQAGG